MSEWRAFEDGRRLGEQLAADVADRLREALRQRGAASLVVPGGRSPLPFFHALSAADLDWSRVTIGATDDRCVPPTSPKSITRLIHDHLLTNAAAQARFVPLGAGRQSLDALPRPFDQLVLGMGADGHMASLFPGAEGLAAALDPEAEPAVIGITPPAADHSRMSLNLAALLDARRIAVLVPGEDKRATYERAQAGASPLELPIAAVLQQRRVPVEVYGTPEEPRWPSTTP